MSDDKFTDRARKVMSLARKEAHRLGHEYIGTEHILIGVALEGSGIGAKLIREAGVEPSKIVVEARKLIPAGPSKPSMGLLPFTPRAKRVIELAQEEASAFSHEYIGTEHLVLGLIKENEGVAAQVLINLGLKLDDLRVKLIAILAVDEGAKSVAPEYIPATKESEYRPLSRCMNGSMCPECTHNEQRNVLLWNERALFLMKSGKS